MSADGPVVDIYYKGNNYYNLIFDFDLAKSNVFRIHVNNPSSLFNWLNTNYLYVGMVLEGVHNIAFFQDKDFVQVRCIIGDLTYPQFQKKYIEGYNAARIWARDLLKGVRVPAEVAILMVQALLTSNVKYDYEAMDRDSKGQGHHIESWMAYGALVNRRAVCEGSSWAMIRILQYLGFTVFPVFGWRDGGFHQWLKVKIGNDWFNLEPTFEGNYQNVPLNHFLVSDQSMIENGYAFMEDTNFRPANNRTYEGEGLNRLVGYYFNNINEYIRQGIDPGWVYVRFVIY